ncbi:unnamed protein product [Wuchereria bancrofti]|uniref:Uncharacterized protein n=2 Tax=Wuchereria bancrofti TaxID=6293 RepID=A0A3P7FP59_WUCBA|nr:unnamed protein product [Wuchereria bancrofti]
MRHARRLPTRVTVLWELVMLPIKDSGQCPQHELVQIIRLKQVEAVPFPQDKLLLSYFQSQQCLLMRVTSSTELLVALVRREGRLLFPVLMPDLLSKNVDGISIGNL